MKKSLLLFAVSLIFNYSKAQNTFPTSGNVGIGTTTPIYNLQIQKSSTSPALMVGGGYSGSPRLQIYGLDSDPNAWMGLGSDMGGGPYEHSLYFPKGASGYTGKFTIGDYNGTQFNSRMTVLSNGNVGIGTANPGNLLDVYGNTSGNQKGLSLTNINTGSNVGTSIYMGFAADSGDPYGIRLIQNGNPTATRSASFAIQRHGPTPGDSDWLNSIFVDYSGNVGIGTTAPDQKLTVNGTIHSTQVKVDLNVPGPDYVFKNDYNLPKLSEVKSYIDKNHHLPEIPPAAQMSKNGVDLGEMNIKLLKKVEELTLYLIEKDKKDKTMQSEMIALRKRIKHLEYNKWVQ